MFRPEGNTEYTQEETLENLFSQMRLIANSWINIKNQEGKTDKEMMEGFVFSLMNIFDGNVSQLPEFQLTACEHKESAQEWRDEGCRWYPEETHLNKTVCLHNMWLNSCKEDENWNK